MNIRNLISNLIAQICEKNYSAANTTLNQVVSEKVKTRIKKTAEKQNLTGKQKKIAKVAPPRDKITGTDFKNLKKSTKKTSKKTK
jgi:uncharacterized membrane protein